MSTERANCRLEGIGNVVMQGRYLEKTAIMCLVRWLS